jgi:hypothetical protein
VRKYIVCRDRHRAEPGESLVVAHSSSSEGSIKSQEEETATDGQSSGIRPTILSLRQSSFSSTGDLYSYDRAESVVVPDPCALSIGR